MKIYSLKKTNGFTIEEIIKEIEDGGQFVIYGYCISIVTMSFRLTSSPYFILSREKTSKYRLKYNILSLFLGWWGLPYGPIYTIKMISMNLKNGGIDFTNEILLKIKEQHSESDTQSTLIFDLEVQFMDSELL